MSLINAIAHQRCSIGKLNPIIDSQNLGEIKCEDGHCLGAAIFNLFNDIG